MAFFWSDDPNGRWLRRTPEVYGNVRVKWLLESIRNMFIIAVAVAVAVPAVAVPALAFIVRCYLLNKQWSIVAI